MSRAAAERAGLVALGVVTLAATVGYAVFGLHPERLPAGELAATVFRLSWELFARGHIVVAALVLAAALTPRVGLRWLGAAGAVALVAFVAEHVGTGWGFPFGGYGYTGLLGATVGGRVPWLIPVSWFLMAAPSFALARHALPGRRRWARVPLAAAWLVAWDLALDPAMSHLTPYWVWEEPGAYYGMPWINLVGWFGTGLVIMAVLELLDPDRWLGDLPTRWAAAYYGLVLLMPLGMVAAAGLHGAVAATLGAVGLLGVAHAGLRGRVRARPRGESDPALAVASP